MTPIASGTFQILESHRGMEAGHAAPSGGPVIPDTEPGPVVGMVVQETTTLNTYKTVFDLRTWTNTTTLGGTFALADTVNDVPSLRHMQKLLS